MQTVHLQAKHILDVKVTICEHQRLVYNIPGAGAAVAVEVVTMEREEIMAKVATPRVLNFIFLLLVGNIYTRACLLIVGLCSSMIEVCHNGLDLRSSRMHSGSELNHFCQRMRAVKAARLVIAAAL